MFLSRTFLQLSIVLLVIVHIKAAAVNQKYSERHGELYDKEKLDNIKEILEALRQAGKQYSVLENQAISDKYLKKQDGTYDIDGEQIIQAILTKIFEALGILKHEKYNALIDVFQKLDGDYDDNENILQKILNLVRDILGLSDGKYYADADGFGSYRQPPLLQRILRELLKGFRMLSGSGKNIFREALDRVMAFIMKLNGNDGY